MKLCIGDKFSNWTVIGETERINGRYYVECRCTCGTIKMVRADQLKNGSSKACGCVRRKQTIAEKKLVYGAGLNDMGLTRNDVVNRTLLYRIYSLWHRMLCRCYNEEYRKRNPSYDGCKVCQRWLLFSNFYNDIQYLPNYDMWVNNPNCKIALDKDILGKHHSYYAPQYCMFVTMADNNIERNERCGCPIRSASAVAKNLAKCSRKIIATKINSNSSTRYPSVRECARQINGYGANILHCLKGRRLTYKGYKFAYDLAEE